MPAGELFEDPGQDIRTRLHGIVHATGRRLPLEGEYRCDFYLPCKLLKHGLAVY